MLKSTNHAEIQNIIEAYQMLCADDAFKCGALNREMEIHDYVSDMADSLEQGIAIGKKQGVEEGITIGEERGIAIGKDQGIAIGKDQGIAELVLSLAKQSGNAPSTVCASLGIDPVQTARILAILPTLDATTP